MLNHTDFLHLPINVYAWMIAGIALLLLALKAFTSYRKSGNPLMSNFFWTWLFWAFGMFFYTLPVAFGLSQHTLDLTTILGDCCEYAGFLVQMHLLWELRLKHRLSFTYLLVPYLVLIGVMISLDYPAVHVVVHGSLNYWNESALASTIYGWLLLVLLVPLAWYFLREAIVAKDLGSRAKSIAFSLGYAAIALTTGVGSILYNRADTVLSSWITIAVFVAMIVLVLSSYIPFRRFKV